MDRYFKFNEESTIEECFDNFKSMAEEDAAALASEMKRQYEMEQEQAAIDEESETLPPEPDTQLLDETGSPIS